MQKEAPGLLETVRREMRLRNYSHKTTSRTSAACASWWTITGRDIRAISRTEISGHTSSILWKSNISRRRACTR